MSELIKRNYKNLNSKRMRELNTAMVYDAIRANKTVSRVDLAKIIGLTTATITNLVNNAIAQGYIIETGTGDSQGGRRPKELELNGDACYVLGVEIKPYEAICMLCDFNANMKFRETIIIDVSQGGNSQIEKIAKTLINILDVSGIVRERVLGVGVCTAGPLDHKKGVMINPPNFPGWQNIEIKTILEKHLNIATFMEKETSSFALAENWLNRKQKYKRILAVNIFRIGIGGGLVLDGKIYHGYNDAGLEVGHITADPVGTKCNCGRIGCLEAMADGKAAQSYYKEITGNDIDIDQLLTLSDEGDEAACEAIIKCAGYIGPALINMKMVLSPDVIFLGGDFMDGSNLLFDECVRIAKSQMYPIGEGNIPIIRSTLGKYSGAYGAVANVLSSAFGVL